MNHLHTALIPQKRKKEKIMKQVLNQSFKHLTSQRALTPIYRHTHPPSHSITPPPHSTLSHTPEVVKKAVIMLK